MAAVDHDVLAGDHAGVVAGQEQSRGGDVLGLAEAQGLALAVAFGQRGVIGQALAQPGRHGNAGADGVGPDALSSVLQCDGTGQADDARLGRGVGMFLPRPGQARHGRRADDRPGAGLGQLRDGVLAEEVGPEQVHRVGLVPDLDGRIDDALLFVHREARVVVHNVQAAVLSQSRRDRGLHRFRLGDIGLDERRPPAGLPRQPDRLLATLGVDLGDDDGGPLLHEGHGAGPANAAAGPGDESNFPFELSSHGPPLGSSG